jgi:cob(I)alamin adenosyltransferase
LNRLSDLLYVLARIDEQRAIIDSVHSVLGIEQLRAAAQPDALADLLLDRDDTKLMNLTLADCDRMIAAGMRCAEQIGVPMVLSVVDANGDVLETRRMDDALIVSIALAAHKAYTAATVRLPTHELATLAQPGQPFFGIEASLPQVTLVGGGLPVKQAGKVAGAVGVSGGSIEQDITVATAMLEAY